MNRTGMAWSEYEVALVRRLWTEGLSAGQISAQLQGRSRNAVIGVVHRLGMPKRVTQGRAYVPRKAMRRKPRPSNRPVAKPSAPKPEKKPNKFDDSPASQAAAALLGAAYKREGLRL